MPFTLTRRLPSGEEKAHETAFPNRRKAALAAFYALYDNRAAPRQVADRVSSQVQNAPLGVWTEAPGGYAFRIDIA